MNFAKYRVQQSTEKKYSSKYEYKYEYEYSIPDIQSTLVNSTMHNSILSLSSTWRPGPGIFPYILLQFHNVYLDNGYVNKTDNSLRKTGPADQFYCILQRLTRFHFIRNYLFIWMCHRLIHRFQR